jgi:hypothetical protein
MRTLSIIVMLLFLVACGSVEPAVEAGDSEESNESSKVSTPVPKEVKSPFSKEANPLGTRLTDETGFPTTS